MTSLGETLRQERLKRNIALEDIASELKISPRFLEAIEKEEFDRLPGGVFARSFVRQYARVLDLDDDEGLTDYIQRLAAPEQKIPQAPAPDAATPPIHLPGVTVWEARAVPSLAWPSWMPAAAMLVIAMLGCSGVYAWWQRGRHTATAQASPATVADVAAEIRKAPLPLAGVSVEPTAASTPQQAAVAPEASPAAASPAPAANPPDAVIPSAGVRVAVTAEVPVWVSVSADGKNLFSGTLRANQTRTVEANDKLLLRVANAGSITVTLNGKPVGPLGTGGQSRTVQFTSGGFQIVPAPKPSSALLDIL